MKLNQLFDLAGKTAVVTGASQGIGSDMAKLLANAGAKVALVARNETKLEALAEEIRAAEGMALSIGCDVLSVDELPAVMRKVNETFGSVDILVNNAGTNIAKPAEEVTEADWDAVLDLNLKSAFFCSQAAARFMKENGRGKIINISSQMAFVGYYKRSAYCSSKGGLLQLTRALAIEWAACGINVNAIAPTFIETPLTERMLDDPEFKEDVLRRIPLGRLAKPEDLFGALLYLSSRASDMVTGQTIVVDGGWTVW
ncbi:SDR family NAD(P)-dependent oxidoreductase [Paenibacillus hamazuiensis]|uniref:SDR family NAD(P)-dependent oxidoreductase n=1 Tax=Paenibacillus hamazuiensis TaxID=2936508 RepID=UPI00200D1969|nr:glucose 1-dehydrogenase [Paenibacillus hamazuiensis]